MHESDTTGRSSQLIWSEVCRVAKSKHDYQKLYTYRHRMYRVYVYINRMYVPHKYIVYTVEIHRIFVCIRTSQSYRCAHDVRCWECRLKLPQICTEALRLL
jgi:hypothetical protein